MMGARTLASGIVGCALLLFATSADAQVSPTPDRDKTWQTVTGITMVAGAGTQLFMPRVFYSDPEVTVGWKGRWHVSVLAPVMTLTVLTSLNEFALKDAFKGNRPGCDDTNAGLAHCDSYGMLSTHSFAAGAAFGHGLGLWIFDTTKWSGGRVNGWALGGDVVAPFVLGFITGLGRGLGNWENAGQIIAGGLTGIGFGFLSGMTYSLMARPECGYTGSLICW
jgi:hypothetical protein